MVFLVHSNICQLFLLVPSLFFMALERRIIHSMQRVIFGIHDMTLQTFLPSFYDAFFFSFFFF